tara:strand:+ start:4829 stop:5086 length:258 start_codon:yes stop_codon:yes gene_type:complete
MNVKRKKNTPSAKYLEVQRRKKIAKRYKALKFVDAIKETRAVSAENHGDDGLALRTRNKKTFQGENATNVVKDQSKKKKVVRKRR